MNKILKKNPHFGGVKGPLLTIVMDGVGIAPAGEGNAVAAAYTPTLDMLMAKYPHIPLKAHGTAVGLPSDDDMGNSEVGHNALGSGQVFAQGAKLVSQSIETGKMFASDTWKKVIGNVKTNNSVLHFLGLFSDGNVHSHIDHLKAMITEAKKEGVHTVRVHILLDGRDVGETSALDYIDPFEDFLSSLRDGSFDIKIASGGGRMKITMDRYEANWQMVADGWRTHVLGEGRQFASAAEAVKTYRAETGAIDQDLPPFVIAENGKPVGTVNDGDSVIFFNFRPDRARQMTRVFTDKEFDGFEREQIKLSHFVTMTEYDPTFDVEVAFPKTFPENVLADVIAANGLKQLHTAETEKYAHVTFFLNGGIEEPKEGEERVLVASPKVATYDLQPEMSAPEVTEKLVAAINEDRADFYIVNFANCDMVGHTGVFDAAVKAVEAVDDALSKVVPAILAKGGFALITADHGNADHMFDVASDGSKHPFTAHTTNRVPFIIVDEKAQLTGIEDGRLSDIAPTMLTMAGIEPSAEMTGRVLATEA